MVGLQSHRSITLFAWVAMFVAASHPPAFAQCMDEQKVTVSDASERDEFGRSVSVGGETAVVGAWWDDCAAGNDCGSAYVYRFDGTSWVEEQKLTASDAAADDYFGFAVSVSGNTVAVGARGGDCAAGANCGSAYVFRFNGTTWVEQQKLTASDAFTGSDLGYSISVSGDTILVGSASASVVGANSGAAYVFRFNGTTWVEQQKLAPSDAAARDFFGYSVSLSGDAALIGSYNDDCAAGADCGSAYIFRFNGTSWVEEQKLTASDAGTGDEFGISVAVSGDTALVGSNLDDCNAGADCGSAYIFQFNGTSWVEGQKLIATDAAALDHFGISVSLSGATAIVGAAWDDCMAGTSCGSGYVYQFDGTTWVEGQKLTASDGGAGDRFGHSVSISGDKAVVGAVFSDCTAGINCGSAYFFQCKSPVCDQVQKLTASDASDGDRFGRVSVSAGGDTVVVGAVWDDCAAGFLCGSAYVYRLNGTDWVEEQKIVASDASAGDWFGISIAIDFDTVVVGAPLDDCASGGNCGSAYIFHFNGSQWDQAQKLTASDGAEADLFGNSVSISGDTVFVAAQADDCAAGEACGSVYVYRFNGTSWVEAQKLTATDADAGDVFGYDISVSDNTAVVGARTSECNAGTNCGSAYVFRFNGTSWVEEQKLTASDEAAGDYFGGSVAVDAETVIVGADSHDCESKSDCGSAYIYRFNGTSWVEKQKLTASDAAVADYFGVAVSVSGNTVVVGAYGGNCVAGFNCGSAYVFRFNGTTWVEEQKLTAFDAAEDDQFGFPVFVSGDTIAIGARRVACAAGADCGAAYLYHCEYLLPGACCFNDGTCMDAEDSASCQDAGGSFQGSGTDCDPNCCVVPPLWPTPTGNSGADNCRSAYVHEIEVPVGPICVGGAQNEQQCGSPADCDGYPCERKRVVTISGDNTPASGPDSCTDSFFDTQADPDNDPGWWEAFFIDGCAYVRLDLCCSDPILTPQWTFMYDGCPCQDGTTIQVSENPNKPYLPAAARGAPFCDEDNLWWQYGPLQPGWYYQPIYSAADGTHGPYQLHITVEACPEAACCFLSCVGGNNPFAVCQNDGACDGGSCEPSCVLTDILDCQEYHHGVFLGPPVTSDVQPYCTGSTCATGSCCVGSGECVDSLSEVTFIPMEKQDCDQMGGQYAGGIRCDGQGICEGLAPDPPVADSTGLNKSRFISFSMANTGGSETALRVNLLSLHHVDPPYTAGSSIPFTAFEGHARWVGPPTQFVESVSDGTPFYASQLQCDPYYQDWSTFGLFHVTGSAIVPSSVYEVENVAASCQGSEANCTAISTPLAIATTRWGDVVDPFNPPSTTSQPDFADIGALVNKFKSATGAPIKARALLAGTNANGDIDPTPDLGFTHISACVDAFKGLPYPYTIASCP